MLDLDKLLVDMRKALAAYHLPAQLLRLARLFLVTFGAQLVALPGGNIGWKALAGAIVAAAEVAVRAVWKTVPKAAAEQAAQNAAANQTA